MPISRLIDLTGKTFGAVRVRSFAFIRNGHTYWNCDCACGASKPLRADELCRGRDSCGCLGRERSSDAVTTHGHVIGRKQSAEYRAWASLKDRCLNPHSQGWDNYGGRGITVCERWLLFEDFLADMGLRPSSRHSIERKNVNLGYGKDNCEWATIDQQARNRRTNRLYTWSGKTQCLKDWESELGMDNGTLRSRLLDYGWSLERAFITPVKKRKLVSQCT